MISGCCRDCTERFIGCHSQCLKYIDYRQKLEAERQKIREKADAECEYRNYVANQAIKSRKYRHGR